MSWAEYLRSMENIYQPDPRNDSFVKFDPELKKFRRVELADYQRSIAELQLHSGVPEAVLIQFETAKNLYLYGWFVYRFYPVSEHHALTCLELALRTRFGKEIPKKYYGGKKPTLKPLLRYAIDCQEIKNAGFRRWRERVEFRARQRYEWAKIREMKEKGLDSTVLDYSAVEITDEDRDWDYLNILLDSLPFSRNDYAHGSASLHNQVRGTIELVGEIINQVFPPSKTVNLQTV